MRERASSSSIITEVKLASLSLVILLVGLSFLNLFQSQTSVIRWLAISQAVSQPISNTTSHPAQATKAQVLENYGKLPLQFEANDGQADPQVRYLVRGSGYSL